MSAAISRDPSLEYSSRLALASLAHLPVIVHYVAAIVLINAHHDTISSSIVVKNAANLDVEHFHFVLQKLLAVRSVGEVFLQLGFHCCLHLWEYLCQVVNLVEAQTCNIAVAGRAETRSAPASSCQVGDFCAEAKRDCAHF